MCFWKQLTKNSYYCPYCQHQTTFLHHCVSELQPTFMSIIFGTLVWVSFSGNKSLPFVWHWYICAVPRNDFSPFRCKCKKWTGLHSFTTWASNSHMHAIINLYGKHKHIHPTCMASSVTMKRLALYIVHYKPELVIKCHIFNGMYKRNTQDWYSSPK